MPVSLRERTYSISSREMWINGRGWACALGGWAWGDESVMMQDVRDCPGERITGAFCMAMESNGGRGCLSEVKPHRIFNQVGGIAIFLNGSDFEAALEIGFHANGEILAGRFSRRDNFHNRETK